MKKIDRIAKKIMDWSIVVFVGAFFGVLLLGLFYGLAGVILG